MKTGKLRIDAPHGLLERLEHRRGVGAGADGEGDEREGVFGEGAEDFIVRGLILAEGLDVADDADDAPPVGLRGCAEVQFFTNGLAAFEVLRGHRLVDEGDLFTALAIGGREGTAVEKRNLHGGEVAGSHQAVIGFGPLTFFRRHLATEEEIRRAPESAEGEKVGCGGGLDAGDGVHGAEGIVDEVASLVAAGRGIAIGR